MAEKLPEWTGFMIVSGVRYCLGRLSYAPGVAMDWCRDNWHLLAENDRHVIVRDVISWLADRELWDGNERPALDYRADWQHFALTRLTHEGPEFAKRAIRQALHQPEMRRRKWVQPFIRLEWLDEYSAAKDVADAS